MAVISEGITLVTAAVRLMAKAKEIHVGGIVARKELGHQCHLSTGEAPSPLCSAHRLGLDRMEVTSQVRDVPLNGGMITVDTPDDSAECGRAQGEDVRVLRRCMRGSICGKSSCKSMAGGPPETNRAH